LRSWLCPATEAMLDMAAIGPGHRVLDVAGGAGDQTRDIARRVGPEGRVQATDIAAGILLFAAQNARRAGTRRRPSVPWRAPCVRAEGSRRSSTARRKPIRSSRSVDDHRLRLERHAEALVHRVPDPMGEGEELRA